MRPYQQKVHDAVNRRACYAAESTHEIPGKMIEELLRMIEERDEVLRELCDALPEDAIGWRSRIRKILEEI